MVARRVECSGAQTSRIRRDGQNQVSSLIPSVRLPSILYTHYNQSQPHLLYSYGGPGAQLVDIKFQRDWHHYLACSLKYVVVTVDGRGTGFKGRKLRNPVRGNLGFFETKDQVEAAR